MTNIEYDPSLKEDDKPRLITDPVVLVEQGKDGEALRFTLHPEFFAHNNAAGWGVLLSDLIDHIAYMGATMNGRDVRDVRAAIVKVLRDEDRFKEKDPERAPQRGAFSFRDVQ
jgi:hypothetical protein